jgi:hypothetical protein
LSICGKHKKLGKNQILWQKVLTILNACGRVHGIRIFFAEDSRKKMWEIIRDSEERNLIMTSQESNMYVEVSGQLSTLDAGINPTSNVEGGFNPEAGRRSERIRRVFRRIFGPFALAGLLAYGAVACSNAEQEGPVSELGERAAEISEGNESNELCPTSWEYQPLEPNAQNRFLENGFDPIKEAESDEEAKSAFADWFAGVAMADHRVLAFTGSIINGNVIDPDSLIDEDNCATPEAVELARNLAELIAENGTITASDAPADGINSGLNANGEIVQAATPGVSGDRTAIHVHISTAEEEKNMWILYRCAQPVTEGQIPGIPQGPTDEPEAPDQPTVSTIPPKEDDGILPGNPDVPADQDPGTPDVPGEGPAGQTPGADGYVPGENVPTAPTTTTTIGNVTVTTQQPATTLPSSPTTNPSQTATTSTPTTAPQNLMPTQP